MNSSKPGIVIGILSAVIGVALAVLATAVGLKFIPLPPLSGFAYGTMLSLFGLLAGIGSIVIGAIYHSQHRLAPAKSTVRPNAD